MGNHRRKIDRAIQSVRHLRCEPLELRLPLAVADSVLASTAYFPAELEYIDIRESSVEGMALEVGSIAPFELNSVSLSDFESLDAAIDQAWAEEIVGYNELIADDFSNDFWLASEDSQIEATGNAIPVDDGVWFSFSSQDFAIVFGVTHDSSVSPVTLLRHGPVADSLPVISPDSLPSLDQDTRDWLSAYSGMPLLHSQWSRVFEGDIESRNILWLEFIPMDDSDLMVEHGSHDIVDTAVEPSANTSSVQDSYYSWNNLSSLHSIELELYTQLHVDNSTTSRARIWRKRESTSAVGITFENLPASTTNVGMAISMLPEGMLPIGGESGMMPIRADRSDETDQHFIVQTALICEYLSSVVVQDPQENGQHSRERNGLNSSSPGRPVELVLAGFLLLVVQTRYCQQRLSQNDGDSLALQFRPSPFRHST